MAIAHSWCSSPIKVAAGPGDLTDRGYTTENWCFTDTVLETILEIPSTFIGGTKIGLQRCTWILYPNQCDPNWILNFLANLLTAENQSYWATCLEKEIKIPRVRVQHGENVLVAQGKIVFIMPKKTHVRTFSSWLRICWNSGWGCADI